MMKALSHYRKDKWVLMYVDHWIKDDIMKEGNLKARSRGTPQGGVISPLLSNLFLHVVFDGWMQNNIRKSRLNATPTTSLYTAKRSDRRSSCLRV